MNDGMSYGQSALWAAVIAILIQELKKAKGFPWLDMHTDVANKVVSAIAAALTAAHFTIGFSPAGMLSMGLGDFKQFGVLLLQQIAMQWMIYHGVLKDKTSTTSIVANDLTAVVGVPGQVGPVGPVGAAGPAGPVGVRGPAGASAT